MLCPGLCLAQLHGWVFRAKRNNQANWRHGMSTTSGSKCPPVKLLPCFARNGTHQSLVPSTSLGKEGEGEEVPAGSCWEVPTILMSSHLEDISGGILFIEITESLRLEKSSQVIKSNLHPNTCISTKSLHKVPHLPFFEHFQGWELHHCPGQPVPEPDHPFH